MHELYYNTMIEGYSNEMKSISLQTSLYDRVSQSATQSRTAYSSTLHNRV